MAHFHFSPRPNRAHEIEWREWDEQAFEQAKAEDKPILLGISAVWCHWCHVMDETTYSDPEVIRLANERYIPIRVDNDERPDINRRYNLGGWPTTAFLTPEGELLTGGTYIPSAQMLGYLQQVADAYTQSKDQILAKVAEISAKREQLAWTRAKSKATLWPDIVDNVLQQVIENYDTRYGGFGDEPKFPQTDAIELVLERYYETGDPALERIFTLTLDNLAQGGMYDQVWGGFFRYSTTRDWSIPHYEKMLEDNAKLLSAYVHAFQVTNRELYLQTIRSLTAYVDLNLSDSARGGFYGSQDADETFYALSSAERERQPVPYVDRRFYTDWNALMSSAYLAAAHVLPPGEGLEADTLQTFALKTLDRLWKDMYRPEQGLYHSAREGEGPQTLNLLSDIARTTTALLDAYQATGDNIYSQRAQILADLALARLYDPQTGSFWSEPPSDRPLGLLRVPEKLMNENAAMAEPLMQITRLIGNARYRDAAEKALDYFAADYARAGFMAADYARAVKHFVTEPVLVHIVGRMEDPRTANLESAALKPYVPDKVVQVLDPARDAVRLDQLGYPDQGTPLAYVCVGEKCLPPVGDGAGIERGLKQVHEQ